MPIYEYVCQKCGHHLEVLQKMSDKPLSRCPECRGRLEKAISQTSFQLKGSGWYQSEYGKGGVKEKTDSTVKTEAGKPEKTEKSDKPAVSEKTDKPGKKEAKAGPAPDSVGTTSKSGE